MAFGAQIQPGDMARAAGYGVRVVDCVASTNDYAVDLLRAGGIGHRDWVVARAQRAGRGRLGRAWQSPPGNFYGTLVLRQTFGAGVGATLSLVAALGVMGALERLLDVSTAARMACKWPNDVLIDGAKVAGVLLETPAVPHRSSVVVGIGVNCAWHPVDTPYAATSLAACGQRVSVPVLFSALSDAMHESLTAWDAGRGLERVLAAWRRRAYRLGETITVSRGKNATFGVFEDIDRHGHLLLRTGEGALQRITAADVSV